LKLRIDSFPTFFVRHYFPQHVMIVFVFDFFNQVLDFLLTHLLAQLTKQY